MSILPAMPNSSNTMSSREIAELTGKEHKNVIRDIRGMLISLYGAEHLEKIAPEQYRNRHSEYIRENAGEILDSILGEDGANWSHEQKRGFSWARDKRGYVTEFNLDRELTLTLVSGYDIPLRHRVVTRLAELENAKAQPALPTPSSTAKQIIQDTLDVAAMFNVPTHYAQAEGVKQARLLTGYDYSHLLLVSPAQNDVHEDERMLEPNDLATYFGISSGIVVNRKLEAAGLQTREGKAWVAAPLGAPHCAVHQWVSGGKSGYNLKWKLGAVAPLLRREVA